VVSVVCKVWFRGLFAGAARSGWLGGRDARVSGFGDAGVREDLVSSVCLAIMYERVSYVLTVFP